MWRRSLLISLISILAISLTFAGVGNSEHALNKKQGAQIPSGKITLSQAGAVPSYIHVVRATGDFTVSLLDSYGDGWDGASLDVLVNGTIVLDDITTTSSQDDYTFSVNDGDSVETTYASGSFESEHSYEFYDNAGVMVASDGPSPGASVSFVADVFALAGDFTVSIMDSYGDGWDGASLDVFVNGTLVLDDITTTSSQDDYVFGIEDGDSVETVYTSGSFESEHTYAFYDNLGNLVASDGSPPGAGIAFVAYVLEPPSEPEVYVNYTGVDHGLVLLGDTASLGDVFEITNIGGGSLTITSITDLSGTEFSSSFDIAIALDADSSHAFGFSYIPTDLSSDEVSFIIETNAGNDTLTLSGAAYDNTLLVESFEDGVPPFGWQANTLSGTYNWDQSSSASADGDYSARYNSSSASTGSSAELISPTLDLTLNTDNNLYFYYAHPTTYSGYTDALQLYVSEDDGATWVELDNILYQDYNWHFMSYDLSAYSGSTFKFKFVTTSDYGTYIYIDQVVGPPAVPSTNTLFFSEYMEGSSNNKGLEIYNGTGTTINLDDYQIAQSVNGGDWAYYHVFPVGATLENDAVWLIANDAVFQGVIDLADEVLGYPSVVHHNGDDARGLVKIIGTDTTFVDIIGIPTEDPGSGWDVAGVTSATANHNLMRKADVVTGNTDWALSAGTNADDSEWIVFDQDFWYGMGYHNEDYPLPGDICSMALIPAEGVNAAAGAPDWYEFTSTVDGSMTITSDINGQTLDTKVYVYDDCEGSSLDSDDDGGAGLTSTLVMDIVAGTTYYIYWSEQYTSSAFDWEFTVVAGTPDFIVSSMEYYGQDTLDVVVTNIGEADSPGYFGTDYHGLYIDGDYLGYISESGIALMVGESFTYTILGLNYDVLGAGLHEVVFEVDTDDDVAEFDETNNNDTLMIDILIPPATPRHLMAIANAEQIDLTWDPAPEESYAQVGRFLQGVSDKKVKHLVEDAEVIQKWAEINAMNAGLRELGNDCTEPYIVSALPFDDTSSTEGFTNSFTYGAGNDVVYQVTIAEAGYLYANTCGGDAGDTKMQIYAADCVTELDANDDACSVRSEVMSAVVAGDYLVVVDGYYAGDLDYILNILFSADSLVQDMSVTDMWYEDDAVFAEISNIGSLDIGSSSVSCRWYVDGEYIGYDFPNALMAGESDTLALEGFSYANLGPGELQVNMIADYWDNIDEIDETNNEDSLTVTIAEPSYIPTYNIYRGAEMIAGAVEPIDYAFHGGFIDFGLTPGEYCYTVTQIMPDLVESAASIEACAEITPNPPLGLMLTANPDATANLNWMAPMPAGEIGYDDGTAESWMSVDVPSSTDHMMALRFNAPIGEFNISNIAVFGLGDEPSMFENLLIVGGAGDGSPDMSNVLFTTANVTMNGTWELGAEWSIVPAGVAATNSEFFVVAQWTDGSEVGPFVGTDDDVVSDRSFWSSDAGTTWNPWSGMFMMHAFLEVGGDVVAIGPSEPVIRNISTVAVPALVNTTVAAPEIGLIPSERSFLGTFKVHRGSESGVYDSVLVDDLNATMYMDAPELGDTPYFYAVTANYDEGDSPFTNEVSYTPEALAWLDLAIDMEAMFVDLDFGDVYGSAGFDLMSIGLDTLDYAIEYHAAMGRIVSREIDGANMYSMDYPPAPGTTTSLQIMLQNDSQDTEWLDSASVTWPIGITVNSSTDFVAVDSETNYLTTNNATGDGATIEWLDGTGSLIYSTQLASSVINITVDASYTGDIYFDYFISGDEWGADPHEVSGSFVFMDPAFMVSITPDMNELVPDSTDEISIEVDVVEYQPGYYPGFISIFNNSVNAPEEIVFPFDIKLAPPMGVLAGTVTSSYDGSTIEGAYVVAVDTVRWEEFFTETMADGSYILDIPVGNYEVGIGHHDYFPMNMNLDIAMDATTTFDAALDANVMAPMDLMAEEDGGIYLSWDMPTVEFPIFYHDGVPSNSFYQNFGQGYGVVFNLSMFGDASIEYLDFVHYGWGVGGSFDYNLHIIDWTDFTTIDVITGLTTEFDAAVAPVLEYGIDLGGLDGFSQVGIFIEPLSGSATDAYPDLSTDESAPAMPGSSFIIDLAAVSALGDVSVNNPTMGDFMLNLWIRAGDDGTLVAAPVISDDNGTRDTTPGSTFDSESKGQISGWSGLGLPMEDQGLRSEFTTFNIYSNVDNAGWGLLGTSDSLGYFDDTVLEDQIIEYTVSAVYDIAESATTDTVTIHFVSTDNVGLPMTYALEQNYPNPFNPITFIRYSLPEVTDVKIVVYNVLGQKVATLVDQSMSAGYHNISWSGLNQGGAPVSSGVYLYRIETENFTDVKKLMFLK